jgi:formate dehydrogenase subunit gamma
MISLNLKPLRREVTDMQIRRHDRVNIFMHWFNVVCWIFLLLTGLGLIKNQDIQIPGGWLAGFMRNIFGSGEALLAAHVAAGFIWSGVFIIYGIFSFKKNVVPFVREILTVSYPDDLLWLFKKGIQMTMGNSVLKKLGMDIHLPDQGFYNVGQKLFAIPSLFGGVVIAVTGFIMAASDIWITDTVIVQWAILIHYVTVMFVFAGLFIHVFMAGIAAGERPAFISMFTGKVPDKYAEHHHKLWYDKVKDSSL